MRKPLLLAMALAVLTGCVGVKPDPQPKIAPPPLPPGLTPKKMTARQPVVSSLVSAASEGPVVLEAWVPEKLYIETRTGLPYLGWLTNDLKQVLLSTTNIVTPVVQWELLSTKCKWLEGDKWFIQVTNRFDQARFYKLLSVPTNSLVFGWRYPFESNLTVNAFAILEGPATNTYTITNPVPGKVLWAPHPIAQGSNTTYYTVVAVDTNGVYSLPANEVYYTPGVSNIFEPPCP